MQKADNLDDEQKEQIAEIIELNKKLIEQNNIIANAGLGIWYIYYKEGKAPRMQPNDKMRELLGIEGMELTEEEVYSSWYDNVVPDAVPSVIKSVDEMKKGKYSENTYLWNHKDKGIIYVRCGGTAMEMSDGTWVISGFHMDATESVLEEQRKKEELRIAKQEAEAASRAKSDFLLSMSHDIRTPMNAITGFTELLKDNLSDEKKAREYIEKIQTSSQFLLSLINNVLEMSRIESGEMCIEEEVWTTEEFNNSLYSVFEEQMKSRNIEFTRSIQVNSHYIYCDSVKLREIFLNLLSNAMKYTPSGGKVSMDLMEMPSDREGFAFFQTKISDTGIGMSKDYLPNIFDEFSRERTVTENKVEGTGLGMPIVKKLVELMGGSIEVESEVGRGTVFTVTLYHRIANEEELVKEENKKIDYERFVGKRILLAEDNDLNAEIAEAILTDAGFGVERAVDGVDCINMLQKSDDNYFDLILMDIQMPNMDGYRACQYIREMSDSSRSNIPIFAITANAFDEDKEKALASGMDGYLTKPVNIREILMKLADFFGE